MANSTICSHISTMYWCVRKEVRKGEVWSDDWWNHYYWVRVSDAEHHDIFILSFTPFQGKYHKTLPLQHSQEILMDDEMELRVGLNLYITEDLIIELLSYSAKIKVIAPQRLNNKSAQDRIWKLKHRMKGFSNNQSLMANN